jgi:hypothetical protein
LFHAQTPSLPTLPPSPGPPGAHANRGAEPGLAATPGPRYHREPRSGPGADRQVRLRTAWAPARTG